MKPINELDPEELRKILFPRRTPDEKKRAEEKKKKRDEPSIGQMLIYIIKDEAQKAAREHIDPVLPLVKRGARQLKDLEDARSAKAKKNSYGSKADEPRVRRAQEAINRINAAAQSWAKGDRTQRVQVIKDLIAYRHTKERDDGTVEISKDAMLNRVAYETKIPYGTLRMWTASIPLRGVPAAQKKTNKI